jgi:integrator complex subunit 4
MSFFAKRTPSIRQNSLRFMIDMLNDDIDDVRIESLIGIASFNQVMKLKEDEVEDVLFNLTEDNIKLRSGIYRFFGEVIIENSKLFITLVETIIVNLGRYAYQDRHFIYKLMQKLGRNHSELVIEIYHRILKFDKRYLA